MEDVLEILRINLVGVIPEDQSVLRASSQGEPVILDAASDAGKAYADTVERLLGEERPFRFIEEEKKVPQTPVRRINYGFTRLFLSRKRTRLILRKNACKSSSPSAAAETRSRITCRSYAKISWK